MMSNTAVGGAPTEKVPCQPCPVTVGRQAELRSLRQALAVVGAGSGQCAVLVGEAGIGKSRLAREVVGWASQQGFAVLTGRAVPGSMPAPFRPLTEALLQLFRRRPLPDDPGLEPWLPLLHPLLPTLIEAVPSAEGRASLRGEAVLQLLTRASPTGLVIVLEDLHWADPDTIALVEYLADNLHETPVLLVLTLRDSPTTVALETARRQRGRAGIVYLPLDRLSPDQSAEMVRACQPGAPVEVIARVRQASEGLPLLVEGLLASPGLPADFVATVTERLGVLSAGQREVIATAAILGPEFDWQILTAITGHGDEAVAGALAAGVDSLLLASRGREVRFRHALTRDAVLASVLPPRQRQLAATALEALVATYPQLDDARQELAVDLALRAGDRPRAGALLAESGRRALSRGALATATEALRRAADLLAGGAGHDQVELDLVEALGLAGRVEEAAAAGGRLIGRVGSDPTTGGVRVEAHLRLAQAAVGGSRWQMARHHLDQAQRIAVSAPSARARIAVLEANVTMAADDYEVARNLVEQVLRSEGVGAEVRCHAFEILGRCHRLDDLPAARTAFEAALVTAEGADLALWRLRALHELGTVDLFDHAGADRLLQARGAAEQAGAMSTTAVLDLQLAAMFTCRWDLDACDAHATSAIAIAERLRLDQVRAKALALLAGSSSMRADLRATEQHAAAAMSAAPEDRGLEGFCWGARATALLLAGDADAAFEPWNRGMAILAKLPHAEPAALRALWPLVLAARRDRRAQAAVENARRLGVAAIRMNRAIIGYAEAVLAGQRGDTRKAMELVALADTGWTNCEGWADLARLLAAPATAADGWADIGRWLAGASDRFDQRGLAALSRRCRDLLAGAAANPWSTAGISPREADVLRLVAEGLANKAIASRLYLSPRTIEKHVEALLRKTGTRSRTELVARLVLVSGPSAGPRPVPSTT